MYMQWAAGLLALVAGFFLVVGLLEMLGNYVQSAQVLFWLMAVGSTAGAYYCWLQV